MYCINSIFKQSKKVVFMSFIAPVFLCFTAAASYFNVPNNFVASQPEVVAQVSNNFNAVENSVNDISRFTALDGLVANRQTDITTQQNTITAQQPSQIKMTSQQVKSGKIPEGLTKGEWQSIQTQMKMSKYQAYPTEYGGYQSANPANGWQINYGLDGTTTLTPYNNSAEDFHISLRLNSVFYQSYKPDDSHNFVQPTNINFNHDRLNYHWNDNITEYWINSEQKLEQWFEIKQRPENHYGRAGHRLEPNLLQVQMTLDTDLPVNLYNNQLRIGTVIYDQLKVWDASGKRITAHLDLQGKHLNVLMDDESAIYPLTIDPSFTQQAYLKASNSAASSNFGSSVSISQNTLVVGAPREGLNSSGAVYVFVRNGTIWTQQAYLKAASPTANDFFGGSVSIFFDTLVVGASGEDSSATGVNGNETDNAAFDSGAAYVFVRNFGVWSQQAYLKASNTDGGDMFGGSVSYFNETVVIGASQEASNSTGVNGGQSNNTFTESGAVYVFVRNGSSWSQQAYLKASNTNAFDLFGRSVSYSNETLVVGASREDSNATGVNGNQNSNLLSDSGAAYVFVRNGTIWSQQAYIKASNTGFGDAFGSDVAILNDTLVVTAASEDSNAIGVNGNQSNNLAEGSGAVYVFVRNGTTWSQQAYLKASNTDSGDGFGGSLSIYFDTLLVGAPREDSNTIGVNGNQSNNSAASSGAAYLFVRNGTTWSQQAYLKASNTDAGDGFGQSVTLSERRLMVGAPGEASNASGVNGNQGDNSTSFAGAVYVRDLTYTVGGTVTGLAVGNNVTLQNNGADSLTISANGAFTFPTALPGATNYAVTVSSQPTTPNQTCSLSNDSGTVTNLDVTDVTVTCVSSLSIGGQVNGLASGNSLILQNNGADNLTISANGAFTFSTPLTDGDTYAVTVSSQPTTPNQVCTINNSSGVANSDIDDIMVNCNTEPTVVSDVYTMTEDSYLEAADKDGQDTPDPNDNSVLVNDSDPESDQLFVVTKGSFTAGGIGGLINMFDNGTFNYEPPTDAFGTATFDYEISDGHSIMQAQLVINVLPVNDAPSFTLAGDVVLALPDFIGNPFEISGFITGFDLGPANESNQVIDQYEVLILSDSNNIVNTVTVKDDGLLSIEFTTNIGVALIDVTLQDDGGTALGGVDRSPVQSFFIAFNDEIIFTNGFEEAGNLLVLKRLIQIKTATVNLDAPRYDASADAIEFYGEWFYLHGDYQSSGKLDTFDRWLKEVLVYKAPFIDYDHDGIENYLDQQPFINRTIL